MSHLASWPKFFPLALTSLAMAVPASARESHSSFEESCKALIGQVVPGGIVASAQRGA
jgi:hypothetical protein